MKNLIDFLFFMSNTDRDIIKSCSQATRSGRGALGLFVIITAIFALLSGSYAISTIFRQVNETSGVSFMPFGGKILSAFIGLIYALLIASIDREIVSAKNWYTTLVRFPLALILGVVLAYPLELKLMEGRINKHLISLIDAENKPSKKLRDNKIKELSSLETSLLQEIKTEKKEITKWSDRMHAETGGLQIQGCSGKAGQGIIYAEAERNMKLHQVNLTEAEEALTNLRLDYNTKYETIMKEYEMSQRSQSFDFLSRMEALGDLKGKSKTVKNTVWGILLVLIILELTPALLRLFTVFEKNEYDLLMEGRQGINNTSISVFANSSISEIERNVNKARTDYISDLKKLVRA